MSKKMRSLREYESLIVLSPELTDEATNEAMEKIHGALAKKNGEILREERQGKRKLSFEVKKHSRGNFVLLHYVGENGVVEELERTFRNMDQVIRFLTTVHGEVRDVEARRVEVEKMVRERAADKARQEAERREQEEKMVAEAAGQG